MVGALLDTNILIDYLHGLDQAREEIRRYAAPSISIVAWIEVMAGMSAEREEITRSFLSGFVRVPLDDAIAERAAGLRRTRRLKIPDAIIWATALERGLPLVTRNSKDFPQDDPTIRIPYIL